MPQDAGALRTAKIMVRLHGDDAEHEAHALYQLHKRAGATTAARVWQRVLTTLASLRADRKRVVH